MKKCVNCDNSKHLGFDKGLVCILSNEVVGVNDTCNCEAVIGKIEKVNHPSHYNKGKYEVIDVIEGWDLNFHLGNAVKYIARAEHKGNKEEDLKKAIWYLQRELQRQ